MSNFIQFKDYLKQARIQNGLSLRGLSKKIDLDAVYLSSLESNRHGHVPSSRILEKLSRALSINLEILKEKASLIEILDKKSDAPFIGEKMKFLNEIEVLLKSYKAEMMKIVKANNFTKGNELKELSSINKLLSIAQKELKIHSGKSILRNFDGQIDKNKMRE